MANRTENVVFVFVILISKLVCSHERAGFHVPYPACMRREGGREGGKGGMEGGRGGEGGRERGKGGVGMESPHATLSCTPTCAPLENLITGNLICVFTVIQTGPLSIL